MTRSIQLADNRLQTAKNQRQLLTVLVNHRRAHPKRAMPRQSLNQERITRTHHRDAHQAVRK